MNGVVPALKELSSSHRDTSCSGAVWRSALLYQGLGVSERGHRRFPGQVCCLN